MLIIPEAFMQVKYVAACYPGSTRARGLVNGANCQHFAYELLRHFGKMIPDFRSQELWEDKALTEVVEIFRPLDLLLFHDSQNPYGAHVAVYLGEDKAIHLSQLKGKPEIWALPEFGKHSQYAVFIGAKRAK